MASAYPSLDMTQHLALQNLLSRLNYQRTRLCQSAESVDSPSTRSEDIANVFGVFGPRGAGKSTVLTALENLDSSVATDTSGGTGLCFVRRLDCSIIPPGIEPGMAILLHLASCLNIGNTLSARSEPLAQREQRIATTPPTEPASRGTFNLDSSLRNLLSTYIQMTRAARDLRLELASSPEDFGASVVEDVKARFTLSGDLADWLQEASLVFQKQIFVIPLDDFDLIPSEDFQEWVIALLDELRQPRLLFVIAADFHRLGHLVFEPRIRWDDKTSRAILNKLLPWQNRVTLEAWQQISARNFSLDIESPRTLETLIAQRSQEYFDDYSLVLSLLPTRPRGLLSLYRGLETDQASDSITSQSAQEKPRRLQEFLSLLATSRQEPLLARRLEEQPLFSWIELLANLDANLNSESWRESTSAALERAFEHELPNDNLSPLHGLLPSRETPQQSAETPTDALTYDGRQDFPGSGPQQPQARHLLVIDSKAVDPTWSDPLRHHELWEDPLRDAEQLAKPLWVEMLLDLSLSTEIDNDDVRPLHNRTRLLSTWRPAASRLHQCTLRLQFSPARVREFFHNYHEINLYSLLYWLTFHVDRNQEDRSSGKAPPHVQIEIGWPSLLLALRGERDPLTPEELDLLLIDSAEIQGMPPEPGPPSTLRILPSRVWALVLLVDALHRCPWRIFSSRRGWELGSYLSLAGAFVRGAYVYALCNAKKIQKKHLPEALRNFLDMMKLRHFTSLVQLTEEEALDWISELLDVSLPLPADSDPLSSSARVYFSLSTTRALEYLNAELKR